MKEFEYTITDPIGIHARPAGLLVKLLAAIKSDVKVAKGEKIVNAKSILGLMGLQAKQGEVIKFIIEGADEEEAIKKVEDFLKENL
ncbi:MAG: HPr family phosphocarrier protein [Fenollaria massiliensis]|uniref:HPr family phosphocarrier protein n=1 Tax=Fenollaria massiliensis TaxID=938288 RepID=UPI0003691F39|nr:HPr family phosphocarrier protein [Fenollaria massiliensis]